MLHYVHSLMRRVAHPTITDNIDVSLGESCAYSILFTTLVVLGVVAVVWSMYKIRLDHRKLGEGFVSARNSQPWWAITASFFSSSMGAWVLSAPADVGAASGAWGVIGYALATGLPWSFLALFGPRMRKLTEGRGFTNTDYIRLRLGSALHMVYALLTFGNIFLACVVEAVTIGHIFVTVSPRVHPGVVIGAVITTVFIYTGLSGLRATLLTDRIQFIVLTLLIVVSMSCIIAKVAPTISSESLHEIGAFRVDGFVSFLVLNISCWFPTFMDPSAWSRCYAADSGDAARKGLFAGSILLLIPMTFFGIAGIVAAAGQRDGTIPDADSTFFALFKVVDTKWSVILLLLATCLSTSTIDTYSSAFASCVASELAHTRRDINFNWCRVASFVVFIIALITALENPPTVMTLFMCANLLSTVATPGLLLSLWDFVSPVGVFTGMVMGSLSICSMGWIRIGTFGGGFQWWLLPEGSTDKTALLTFTLAGSVTTLTILGASQLNFWLDPNCRTHQIEAFEKLRNCGKSEVIPLKSDIAASESKSNINADYSKRLGQPGY